uniref:Uncharacterized protein n=1 Tax=Oncorhynchus tshawytscha TaxID=74940 RepID=A0AAZ3R8P1_ONCTS
MENRATEMSNIVQKSFTFEEYEDPKQSLNVSIPELGAGVSLPGVVAAKCGAQVILSDSAELPLCLENCRRTCEVNELPNVLVVGITW